MNIVDGYYIIDQDEVKANIVKMQDICLKDYSYVIEILIVKEWSRHGDVRGMYDVIKKVNIYLKDLNDKKAYQKAKEKIMECQLFVNTIVDEKFAKVKKIGELV